MALPFFRFNYSKWFLWVITSLFFFLSIFFCASCASCCYVCGTRCKKNTIHISKWNIEWNDWMYALKMTLKLITRHLFYFIHQFFVLLFFQLMELHTWQTHITYVTKLSFRALFFFCFCFSFSFLYMKLYVFFCARDVACEWFWPGSFVHFCSFFFTLRRV